MNPIPTEINQLFEMLESARHQDYIGEPISQLEHALQCAKIAADSQSSDEMIIAALFHDLGHLCAAPNAARMDEFGVDNHHRLAAELLRTKGFHEKIPTLVEGHVEAKRYLVAKNPKYLSELSSASQETLRRQGGPMSSEEMEKFETHPLFKDMLKLRVCDDRAKEVDWEVPPLESYRERVVAYLAHRDRKPSSRSL